VFFLLTIWSNPAYAYLDPGSGSALISTLVAAGAGLLYALKSFFYKFSGQAPEQSAEPSDIVIFTEGKIYWGTFRLIVDELIRRKIFFRYLTLDLHDPGLEIESCYMQSRLVSAKKSGFLFIERVNARVMLATTPNIGTAGFPLKRPDVDQLIHVFHSVSDISTYRKGSLDHYDTVILAGEFQRESIRLIEKKRSLPKKKLVTLGLPYLDELYTHITELPRVERNDGRVRILIGSSWGEMRCLRIYGTDFIRTLAQMGYQIIIRPHPHSFVYEADYIMQCEQALMNYSSVTWDRDVSPYKAMCDAVILISDTSAIRFDYAFLFNKPVITLDIPRQNLTDFEADDLAEDWADQACKEIGVVVDQETINDLEPMICRLLKNYDNRGNKAMRDSVIANWSHSSEKIVDYLLQQHQG